MLARAITLAASFTFTVVVGRSVGPEVTGSFFALLALTTFAGMVGRRGADLYALKTAGALLRPDGSLAVAWLLRRSLIGTSVAAGLLTAVVTLILILRDASASDVAGALALVWSAPITSRAIVHSAILRACGRPASGAFAEMGLTQLLAIPGVIALGPRGDTLGLMVPGVSYATAAAATATWATMRTVPIVAGRPSPPDSAITPHSRMMTHMAVSSVIFYALTWMPIVALWLTASPEEAGYFAAANRFVSLLPLITTIQMTSTLPAVASMVAVGQTLEATHRLRRTSLAAASFCLPAMVVVSVWPAQLLAIFGPEFAPAATTLRALGVAMAVVVMLGPVNQVMTVTGFERTSIRIALCALAVGGPASLAAASSWGAWGAGLAGGLSLLTFNAAGAVILSRHGIAPSFLIPPRATHRSP